MPNAGDEYAALIKEQMEGAQAKQASFEQRGIAVVTTSGTLASLLFAIVAAITSKSTYVLSTFPRVCLIGALASFVLAAICGLFVNSPQLRRSVIGVDISSFRDDVLNVQQWSADATLGSLAATDVRLDVLQEARVGNALRSRILAAGFGFEALATIVLGIGIASILIN